MRKTRLAIALSTVLGVTAIEPASAVVLADGTYDMVINQTPWNGGQNPSTAYEWGSDGAWNSSFTFGSLPGAASVAMYDDTLAVPVNGRYDGNINDGVQGTVAIQVSSGLITGTGRFEFDMLPSTAGGNFVEYGDSTDFTGSIDAGGNITLTPTGILGAIAGFPALVDERWNVDNWNGVSGTYGGYNPPNSNTAYDTFTTGSANNGVDTINGAPYDGTTAILVKGGHCGFDWGGIVGCNYFEVWNVSFIPTEVPIPATLWLFGSGLIGLLGVARTRKK